jgi:hypothetical protein
VPSPDRHRRAALLLGADTSISGSSVIPSRAASRLFPQEPPLSLVMIVGQLRLTAIDLPRGAGVADIEILTRVDEALGLPPV